MLPEIDLMAEPAALRECLAIERKLSADFAYDAVYWRALLQRPSVVCAAFGTNNQIAVYLLAGFIREDEYRQFVTGKLRDYDLDPVTPDQPCHLYLCSAYKRGLAPIAPYFQLFLRKVAERLEDHLFCTDMFGVAVSQAGRRFAESIGMTASCAVPQGELFTGPLLFKPRSTSAHASR